MDYLEPHFVFWVKPEYTKAGVQVCHFIPSLALHFYYHSQDFYIEHAANYQNSGNSLDDYASNTSSTRRNIRRAP